MLASSLSLTDIFHSKDIASDMAHTGQSPGYPADTLYNHNISKQIWSCTSYDQLA